MKRIKSTNQKNTRTLKKKENYKFLKIPDERKKYEKNTSK